jgi:hypothetical protein
MVGFWGASGHLLSSRQAWTKITGLSLAALFTFLLASLIVATPASAQESAACDQYGCAEEPAPEELAPPAVTDPTVEQSPAVEPASPVESEAAPEESVGVTEPSTLTADKDIEDNLSEGGADTTYPAVDPIPTPEPVPAPAETEAAAPAPSGEEQEDPIARESEDVSPEKSDERNVETEESDSDDEDRAVEPSESTEKPLPGYSYAGEPCEDSNCGLAPVDEHMRCATYQTALGEKVYGCSDPRTFNKKGCYEITFYTEEGKPYSNLDTCSGEKAYAPPKPPEGEFEYWAPPDNPYAGHRDRPWSRYTAPCVKNNRPSGLPVDHCGLEGYPKKGWECEWFYDTRFGTVRGCYTWKDMSYENTLCTGNVRVYDEIGRPLGTFTDCEAPRRERFCGNDDCGIKRNLSEEWECSRYSQWFGTLYGEPNRSEWTECLNWEHHEKFVEKGTKKYASRRCTWWFDKDGRPLDHDTCGHQGDSDVFNFAERDAREANDAVNDPSSDGAPEFSSSRSGLNAPLISASSSSAMTSVSPLGGESTYGLPRPEEGSASGPDRPTGGFEAASFGPELGTTRDERGTGFAGNPSADSEVSGGDQMKEGETTGGNESAETLNGSMRSDQGTTGQSGSGGIAADAAEWATSLDDVKGTDARETSADATTAVRAARDGGEPEAHPGPGNLTAKGQGAVLAGGALEGLPADAERSRLAVPEDIESLREAVGVALPFAALGAIGIVYGVRRWFFA